MNNPQPDRSGTFAPRREWLAMAGLACATLLVCVYFAPRGFRAGFTDMAHDGYQLRQVLDLDAGGTIFKDTFDQYGPLSGYLNLAGYRLFGHTLIAVKYALGFWYAGIAILVYRLSRHLLPIGWSVVAGVIWLAVAPFYQHGVMISPHAYVLFFQALGTLALIDYTETDRLRYLAIVGVCCGLCWALKTTMGVLFAVGVVAYLAIRPFTAGTSPRRTATALAVVLASGAFIAALTLAWLLAHGALHDWYIQTVVFPRDFYLEARTGRAPSTVLSALLFALNFLLLNIDVLRQDVSVSWHVMRLTVVLMAVLLWRQRRAPELLLITACLAPVLWLAAYPSANFMHQWWTGSLAIPAFVYCVQVAVRDALQRWPRIAVAWEAPVMAAVLVVVFWSSVAVRLQATRDRAMTLTETLDVPRALRGVRTDRPTAEAFREIYRSMVNFREHHPGARVVSNDHCNGFSNCVADSLLWLSFLDDNRHDHPVYWPMPVLSTTLYPDYDERVRQTIERTPTLIVDSWAGIKLPDNGIDGYELLVSIRTQYGYWYVFSPVHPGAAAHGEVTSRLDISGVPAATRQVPVQGAQHSDDVAVDPRSGTAVQRPLYTWPAHFDVPPLREPIPMDPATATVRDAAVAVDGGRWIVRGVEQSPWSTLLEFPEQFVNRGDYFVATGTVYQSRCRFGLMRDGDYAGYVDITGPGPFTVVVAPPRSGRYRLVFGNGLPVPWQEVVEERGVQGLIGVMLGWRRPISFDVDQAGWVRRDSESPVALVYQRKHRAVQLESDEELRAAAAAADRDEAEERLAEQNRIEKAREERAREERAREDEAAAARAAKAQAAATAAAQTAAQAAAAQAAAQVAAAQAAAPVAEARTEGSLDGAQRQHFQLYKWPATARIPAALPQPPPLDTSTASRAAILDIRDGSWLIRGSAEARYSYLLKFADQPVGEGEYFVATGSLEEGGFTFGLLRDEKWVGVVNVADPGRFAVVIMPPEPGRYALVLANNVDTKWWQLIRRHGADGVLRLIRGASLPNVFRVDRAGWIAPAPVPPPVETASAAEKPARTPKQPAAALAVR